MRQHHYSFAVLAYRIPICCKRSGIWNRGDQDRWGRFAAPRRPGWRFDDYHARQCVRSLLRLIPKTRMLRRKVGPTIAPCNS